MSDYNRFYSIIIHQKSSIMQTNNCPLLFRDVSVQHFINHPQMMEAPGLEVEIDETQI